MHTKEPGNMLVSLSVFLLILAVGHIERFGRVLKLR